jgi:hypothetical protein
MILNKSASAHIRPSRTNSKSNLLLQSLPFRRMIARLFVMGGTNAQLTSRRQVSHSGHPASARLHQTNQSSH